MRTTPDGCLSDLAVDRLVAESNPTAAARDHLDACSSCRARFEAFARERDAFLTDQSLASALTVALRRRAHARRWPIAGASLGVVALAAAVLLFLRPKPSEDSATRLKGSARIGFYVKHGDDVRLGTGGARVRPGDALRFVYSTNEARYIAVLSLDGARRASIYYPTSTSSAERVEPAVDRPLESSTLLDETLGAERLYGIFCKQPVALEPIRTALEGKGTLPPLEDCIVDTLEIRKEAATIP